MPLTRNLYKEDEVVASLQLCILHGRCVEAAFWATEMLDSNMTTQFFSVLRTIWLLGFGIGALPWLAEVRRVENLEELESDVLLELVVSLARAQRDTSYIILAGTKAPPEQVDLCLVPKGLTGVDSFFASAVMQGRTVTAWRALPSIGIRTLSTVAAYKHGEAGTKIIALCEEYPALIVAALCLARGELQARLDKPLLPMLDEVVDALTEWDTLKGRARRVYAVPYEALYWATARGSMTVYQSADAGLRGSLERPGKLWGSVFWDSIAEDLGGWLAVRADAATRERFYDEYFPDDIPDEWSLSDRAKSHGGGCMQPDTTPSLSRFLQTWFGRYPSAVIWGQWDAAIQNISVKNLGEIIAVSQPVELNLVRNGRRSFRLV